MPTLEKPLRFSFPSFQDYFEKCKSFIANVQDELTVSIAHDPVASDQQARTIESYRVGMREILAFADSYLDLAESEALKKLPPRSKELTDLDRETRVAAAVSTERRFRDVVKGICESIDTRISYVQTRLRVFSAAEGQKYT